MSDKIICTMVFEIEPILFKSMNPLNTETPWGVPYVVGMGDAFEESDKLREENDRLRRGDQI